MSDAETQSAAPAMTTGKAIMIYAGAVAILFALIALTANFDAIPGIVAWVGYFLLGFSLNRVVLRGLIEWHPVYNTLKNVASAKLWMLFLWPLKYPGLFFQLLVSKHL